MDSDPFKEVAKEIVNDMYSSLFPCKEAEELFLLDLIVRAMKQTGQGNKHFNFYRAWEGN